MIEEKLIGVRDEIRFSKFIHREGSFETPYTLYGISPDYKNLQKIHDFPMLHFIKKAHWWRRGAFIALAHENFLFIVHTSEYRIVKFDVLSGRVERVFNRKYPRLKSGEEKDEKDIYNPVPKQLLPPALDYVFDILWLQVCRDALWVFTSTTKDEGAKMLVDVFAWKESISIASTWSSQPTKRNTGSTTAWSQMIVRFLSPKKIRTPAF